MHGAYPLAYFKMFIASVRQFQKYVFITQGLYYFLYKNIQNE